MTATFFHDGKLNTVPYGQSNKLLLLACSIVLTHFAAFYNVLFARLGAGSWLTYALDMLMAHRKLRLTMCGKNSVIPLRRQKLPVLLLRKSGKKGTKA